MFKAFFNLPVFCIGLLSLLLAACGSNSASSPASNPPGTEPTVTPAPDNGQTTTTPVGTKFAILDTAGNTERVSTSSAGIQGDLDSINSSISDDGQIVVFDSTSTNLVADDTNATWDVFAKNRRDNTTTRLSVATDGSQGDGASLDSTVSVDGRYVVFSSEATNLVAGDANGVSDIFLHDTLTGITTLISKNDNNEQGNGLSETPNISPDGRYIVFVSESTNLSLVDNNTGKDIYVHDRVNATTTLVSSNALGEVGNGQSINPDVSADGNRIVFASEASNLVDADTNSTMDIFLKDIAAGSVLRVSTDAAGQQSNGYSDTPSISSDGNTVAYRSLATNLVPNVTVVSRQIYAKDIVTGASEIVSISNQGELANKGSFFSTAISGNGQIIAFYTEADNLEPLDNNLSWDVFVRDRSRQLTRLVSTNSAGQIGDGSSFLPAMNQQGNYISFGSSATNFATGDTNTHWDIFLHVITPLNLPPVANAGADQEVHKGAVVQLDGSQSYDPDATATGPGPVATYLWQVVSAPAGSTAVPSDVSLATPTFTPDLEGVYVIGLTVNDGVFDSVQSTMTLTVTANLAPVANLTIDISSGTQPLTVHVDASTSTDPETDSLSYAWEFGDPQSGAENTSTLISAVHTYKDGGNYTIILTVTDVFGNQSQVFTNVEVIAVNNAPEIVALASVNSGPAPLTVQFKANATDPDGDPLSYQWDFADGSADSRSDVANPVHTFTTPGSYEVTVTVSDGQLSTSAAVTVIVESPLVFKVTEAVIEYEYDNTVNAKVAFEASLSGLPPLSPGQDLQVVVRIDDKLLLDVPLSEFVLEKDDTGSDEWVYRQAYIKAEIEPAQTEFEFRRERLLLGESIDNSNGIDFVIYIGSYSAIDTVIMQNITAITCGDDNTASDCHAGATGGVKLIYRAPN